MTAGDGPVSTGHNRLAALAAEIVKHHGAAGLATREAIRHAIEAGRRLAPFDMKAISDALAALERAVA
jgi:hypothetical protein